MNTRTIGVIIRREYLNRVKKKTFLLITFLTPVLFAALCILPTLIMMGTKEESKTIAVVDNSGIVMPYLNDTETIHYVNLTEVGVDDIKADMKSYGVDAVLNISELDAATSTVKAESFSPKPLGMEMTENIDSKINDAIEAYRIDEYKIDDLRNIMNSVRSNVHTVSYTLDDSGNETLTESGVYMLVSMLLGMIIYFFIFLFGGQVMSSVIEEKSSRVVEVLVSSVKATELMFGKIFGVALVALTQFFLWIVLTLVIVGVAGGVLKSTVLGDKDPAEMVEAMSAGMGAGMGDVNAMNTMGIDIAAMTAAAPADSLAAAEPTGLDAALSTLQSLPYGQILISFVLFFLFGYLLYASLFAAIGSAVENEADTQQLQLPVTIPVLLAFFVALYAYKAPDSGLVFWCSMIPFTSPVVMLARVPFGVPMWQLVLSISLLIATFVGVAVMSAKIYKVGILMYGKKSTFKDLWRWLKMK